MKLRHLEYTFSQIENKKIVIIGDVMLDKYIYGNVERISPEVPVPIVEIQKEEYKLGGAANVALNIKKLGAEPILISVIGNDENGRKLQDTLYQNNITDEYFLFENKRKTTCKTRIMSDIHQMMRLDYEEKTNIWELSEQKILSFLYHLVDNFDIILLQDYNKGVLTKSLIHNVLEFCKTHNKKVLVDPKFENFIEYKDVFLFKPNKKEFKNVILKPLDTYEEQIEEGTKFLKEMKIENLVLTLSQEGMLLLNNIDNKISIHKIPTLAKRVADVSGAGDTVIATIATLLNSELELVEVLNIANIAAGIVVEEVGIVAITKEKLIEHVDKLIKQEYLQ
jgi:rfaE bifunctional protein kinase chain/domain